MSEKYLPLYRKYRPQTLEELVGQEHVKKTLTSAIELGKIAHAYLFTGPRGTGKTSTARILAKSLNCKNGPTVHPCGECESCRDITNSIPIDVIEIDAASNRKVEDAQNILEKIQYVPVNGKYKIYIIDEVHMLSNTAFNALLKTLEEPPENVIFILATTEVHKVLDTIKSRCQRYDFRRITIDDIVKHLRYISDKEGINISDDALFNIAKNSAGGMRDSISLLDQLSIIGVSKQITSEDVNAILGRISFDVLRELSEKIISSSPNEAIEILNSIYNSGNDPLQILINLAEYFKNLLIVKTCGKELLTELTGWNESQLAEVSEQKELLEVHQIVFLIERISYYIKEVKLASNQHLWLEVGMIDLANMTENSKLLDLQERVKALENGSTEIHVQSNSKQKQIQAPHNVTRPAPVQPEEIVESPKPAEKVEAESTSEDDFTPPPMSKISKGDDIQTMWESLLKNVKSPATKALLNLASPVKIASDEVIITFKNEKLVAQMTTNNKKDMVIEAANALFGQSGSKVTIRLPQPGDDKIISESTKETAHKEEKKNPYKLVEQKSEIKPEIIQPVQETNEETVTEEIDSPKEQRFASDQERMVLELFDGKYIE